MGKHFHWAKNDGAWGSWAVEIQLDRDYQTRRKLQVVLVLSLLFEANCDWSPIIYIQCWRRVLINIFLGVVVVQSQLIYKSHKIKYTYGLEQEYCFFF